MDHGQGETGNAPQQVDTYETLAQTIDHELLHPALSDSAVAEGCRLAREYRVASVVVRPVDVDAVIRWMQGSGVKVASTVGYPDGTSNTATKLYEGRDLLRRGVKELDMMISVGKLISREFQFVETELMQMAKSCAEAGATLKVNLGSQYLDNDLKIIAFKICKRIEAPFVGVGYSLQDLSLLRPLLKDRVQMKAVSGIDSLAHALEVREAGCTRMAATATASILDDWKVQLEQTAAGHATEG
jgi:deoxyribose-phosphate aldolase